jgi:ketosteroid isomerase-like protein
MSEKMARRTTMLDGIPNDDSGGTDYVQGQSRAHPPNLMTRGAALRPTGSVSVAAPDSVHRLKNVVFGFGGCRAVNRRNRSAVHYSRGGTHMKVHSAVAGAWIMMAGAELAGCSSSDGRLPSAVTTEVARDFNEGDALRTAANYTDDAQILAPQHPAVQGKTAIVAFFKANIDKYLGFGNDSTWSLVRGDVAIEQGVYSVRNVRVGENVESGKYIRIWKKTNNGTWKLYRDMYSSDSATPAAVSVSPGEAPGPG